MSLEASPAAPVCPFTVGNVTVLSLGKLVDAPAFYRDPTKGTSTNIVVYPVGFRISRPGPASDPSAPDVPYIAEVRANHDASAPVFVVTPSDAPDEEETGSSCLAPWYVLLKKRRPDKNLPGSGVTCFALTEKPIMSALRALDGGAELFAKLEGLVNQRAERPQRKVSAPKQFLEAEKPPRQTGAKKGREQDAAGDTTGPQGTPADADDGLPAKVPRKPRATTDGPAKGRRMTQTSLMEFFGPAGGGGASAIAGTTAAESQLLALGPVRRPLVGKSEAANARAVFFAEFEGAKENADMLARVVAKGARRRLENFLWQYTSERAKVDLARRYPQVAEALAAKANAAPVPPHDTEIAAPTDQSMNLVVADVGLPAPRAPSGRRSTSRSAKPSQ